MQNTIGKSTQSIWGGELEHPLFERSTQVPVVHSVSFAYKDIDTWLHYKGGTARHTCTNSKLNLQTFRQ